MFGNTLNIINLWGVVLVFDNIVETEICIAGAVSSYSILAHQPPDPVHHHAAKCWHITGWSQPQAEQEDTVCPLAGC